MSNARVDSLGFVKKPEDYDYLHVEWERSGTLVKITSEANRTDIRVEDIEWLRNVLFQIDYELKKEE